MPDLLDDILKDNTSDEDATKAAADAAAAADNTGQQADEGNKPDEGDKGEPSVSDILDQMKQLQKQNKGLIKDIQAERSKRQNAQGQFNQLSATVNDVLQRQTATQTQTTDTQANKPKGIPVSYDDEGNPYVDPNDIQHLVGAVDQQVRGVNDKVDAMAELQAQEAAQKAALDGILNQKDGYRSAYDKVNKAYQWVNNKVMELQKQHGTQGIVPTNQVLELAKSGHIDLEEYNKTFSDLPFDQVVRSHDTSFEMERVLDNVLSVLGQDSTPADEKNKDAQNQDGKTTEDPEHQAHSDVFKKVLKKPASLGNVANNQDSQPDAFERLASISAEDFVDSLTDADVDKLERAMEREELRQYG
jgi:hypothetical protein